MRQSLFLVFPTKQDINQSPQLQRLAKILQFLMEQYLCVSGKTGLKILRRVGTIFFLEKKYNFMHFENLGFTSKFS